MYIIMLICNIICYRYLIYTLQYWNIVKQIVAAQYFVYTIYCGSKKKPPAFPSAVRCLVFTWKIRIRSSFACTGRILAKALSSACSPRAF